MVSDAYAPVRQYSWGSVAAMMAPCGLGLGVVQEHESHWRCAWTTTPSTGDAGRGSAYVLNAWGVIGIDRTRTRT
jgi:hypothetical protein